MPADASSPILPAFDQLREHPDAVPEEIPGLLERLAEVPAPRDPRGVRHALVVVLALTACAVGAGSTSLPAVGERITAAGATSPSAPFASPERAPSPPASGIPAGGGSRFDRLGPRRFPFLAAVFDAAARRSTDTRQRAP
ncbi:transposase family protein [Streptomyces sp. NPDC007189]|uniref:transposase family protein n=1 Tax=Streptomyces sp. NPDC007189 TaxID=3154315 RepID=UPI003455CABF